MTRRCNQTWLHHRLPSRKESSTEETTTSETTTTEDHATEAEEQSWWRQRRGRLMAFGLGKIAVLESKLDIYEDLSKEMLTNLKKQSGLSQKIATGLYYLGAL